MFFGVTIEIALSLRYIIIIIIIIIIIEKRYSISFLVEYVALKNKFLIEMKCFKLIQIFSYSDFLIETKFLIEMTSK